MTSARAGVEVFVYSCRECSSRWDLSLSGQAGWVWCVHSKLNTPDWSVLIISQTESLPPERSSDLQLEPTECRAELVTVTVRTCSWLCVGLDWPQSAVDRRQQIIFNVLIATRRYNRPSVCPLTLQKRPQIKKTKRIWSIECNWSATKFFPPFFQLRSTFESDW